MRRADNLTGEPQPPGNLKSLYRPIQGLIFLYVSTSLAWRCLVVRSNVLSDNGYFTCHRVNIYIFHIQPEESIYMTCAFSHSDSDYLSTQF